MFVMFGTNNTLYLFLYFGSNFSTILDLMFSKSKGLSSTPCTSLTRIHTWPVFL